MRKANRLTKFAALTISCVISYLVGPLKAQESLRLQAGKILEL